MGSSSSKVYNNNVKETHRALIGKLLKLTPEALVNQAVEDPDIYEACKKHDILRHSFIIAAARKYHSEKFFYANVYNRTANFMLMLDEFLQIQDEIGMKRERKTSDFRLFKWFSYPRRDRRGRFETGGW